MVCKHSYLIQTVLTLVPASIPFTVVTPDVFLLKMRHPCVSLPKGLVVTVLAAAASSLLQLQVLG